MKLERLASRSDGTVAAVVTTSAGDDVQVNFSTSVRGGIRVANPDRPIFDQEALDAAAVRAIVTAVLAFDAVAVHGREQQG